MGRVRSAVPRSRLPLHRRPFADPAALRRWSLVAALAIVTTALVSHALGGAEDARRRWGETRSVLVVERAVAAGDPLAGSVARRTWPVALVPAGALASMPHAAEAAGPAGPGTPLTDALLAEPGAGRADGRRRVAIAAGAAPLPLEPGDRVDVWATVDPSLAGGSTATRRVAAAAVVTSTDAEATVVAVTADEVRPTTEATALATVTLVAVG